MLCIYEVKRQFSHSSASSDEPDLRHVYRSRHSCSQPLLPKSSQYHACLNQAGVVKHQPLYFIAMPVPQIVKYCQYHCQGNCCRQ